jgi:hypothetical protein
VQPQVFNGRTISFVLNSEWSPDLSMPPFMSAQFLMYRFIPNITLRDGILYGSLQIREVLNPMEKLSVSSQLQMLTNPWMASAILGNLGVQPQSVVGDLQSIRIHGNNCSYRIVDGYAIMTGQPVRCYLGIIDMGSSAVEIISITLLQLWPSLMPQILEVFTSISPLGAAGLREPAREAPVFINKQDNGNITFKLKQEDGMLKIFDSLNIPEHAKVNIYIDGRNLSIGRDVQVNGQINFGDNNKMGGLSMSNDQINISHVSGIVNVKSRLDNVSQAINNSSNLQDGSKQELTRLLQELRVALEPAAKSQPDDGERIVQSAEMVVNEVVKEKPNKSFLNLTLAGLTEAAKAVESIAPAVIGVATKIASFVATLL